ncbi:uncharacterized protein M6B38_364155 [Iris pallida]|uniref:Receptor-like serine/threonine-protein kinase n=1 Tax=Iris pallida TaxID=29817 RepID=A0AAX6GHG7_IRIPA|nr:uncharacterized protein M6B38_364155 [Iris pallida]
MAAPRDLRLHSNPLLLLLLLFLFICHNSRISVAVDFISRNQTISGDQTIISEGGKFELGFYSQGNFIAVWYKNTDGTPVWVANRGNPVKFTVLSELKISDDGNLVLFDQLNSQIWSTGVPFINSSSPVAVLLDSGNLVLRDGSDPNRVFWQSCDHPTDTWLPGCYLGLNKATGENRRLVSNKKYDISPGGYSLEIDSNQIVLKWLPLGRQYWASGRFDGQNFSSAPEMMSTRCRFGYVSNETMNYFTYASPQDDGTSRITVTDSGMIQQVGWDKDKQQQTVYSVEPANHCDVYVSCGPFGFSMCNEMDWACNCPEGFKRKLYPSASYCERKETLQCGTKDRFLLTPNLVVVGNPDRSPLVGSAEDCELACLSNCSCTAYSYGRSCSVWFGEYWELQEVSSNGTNVDSLYLRIGVPQSGGLFRSSKIGGSLWVVLGGTASSIAFCLVIYLLMRRRRRHDMKMVGGTLRTYSYSELKQLTRNFSEVLGSGGFGSVFRGTLPDSTSIAVKKLEGNLQGEKQFRSEVSLGLIQHVNVIRLHGFCSENAKKLLVYEFMPKGSLENHLFRSSSKVLDWKTRYQIALGTARGLCYLHEKCRDCIIHCDIKPENILLDASYVPKVADFGLAKHVGRDFNDVLTTMRGTIGYLAPEWISGSSITAKADTYSYGMVLLEIISGRRNTEVLRENEAYYFPLLACSKVVKGDFLSLLDHRLGADANLEELDRACKVACWCIQDDEKCRPSMGQVVHILEGVVEVDTPPMPRFLQLIAENPESVVYFSGL